MTFWKVWKTFFRLIKEQSLLLDRARKTVSWLFVKCLQVKKEAKVSCSQPNWPSKRNKAYAMGEITNKYILDRHYSSQEHPQRAPPCIRETLYNGRYTVIPMYYW